LSGEFFEIASGDATASTRTTAETARITTDTTCRSAVAVHRISQTFTQVSRCTIDHDSFLDLYRSAKVRDPGLFESRGSEPLATDQSIATVESQLKIQFPEAYRWFLQAIGAGDFGPAWIYGVQPGSDFYLIDQQKHWPHADAAGLIPINDDGCGNAFGFLRGGGAAVYGWDHETGVLEQVSDDFLSFVAEIAFET
jgi:hypothetical protein